MRRKIIALKLVLLSLFITPCKSENKYPKNIEHVIVIGIDGMSAQGFKKANTPNMDKLVNNGTLCEFVRTVQPSSSSPNWASMLMGAGTEIHGITSNDWKTAGSELEPAAITDAGSFPSLLYVIRAQKPNAELGMIYNWDGFGDLFEKNKANMDKTYPTQDATAEAIIDYIKTKKPLMLFTQLDEVDGAGHYYGHMTEGYLNAVTKVDSIVGRIVQAVKDAGIEDKTMIMIVADHGGVGLSHGGTSRKEINVSFVISGSGVKKGYKAPIEVYIYDVAPTVVFALGLKEPYAWRGKAVQCAFEGFYAPVDPLRVKIPSTPPVIGEDNLYEQGGLYIDRTATVKITPDDKNAVVYYTIDGTEPTKSSTKYTQPFELTTTTVVKARSYDQGGKNESAVSAAYYRFVKSTGNNGLNTEFYPGRNWTSIPDFSKMKPIKTWISPEINVDSKFLNPMLYPGESSLGVIFTGKLQIDRTGDYIFYLKSDDGSKLYLDGNPVVSNDGDHGPIEKQGSIALTEGKHDIKVEFINAGGGYWIDAYYKGPGVPKQIIPADKLFIK